MLNDFKSSGIDKIFCDSLHALKYAYNNRLIDSGSTILTVSPALIENKDKFPELVIENISSVWGRDRLFKYQRTIKDFSTDIYNCCISDDNLSDYALALSRESVNASKIIYKAGMLKHIDTIEARGMLSVEQGADLRLEKINPPYEKLLASNDNFMNVFIPFEPPVDYGIKMPSLIDRYKRAGMEAVIYRVGMFLTRKIPLFWKKNIEIYILRENELLIETAYHLIKKRYAVRSIDPCPVLFEDTEYINNKIRSSLYHIIYSRIKDWVCDGVIEACVDEVLNNMSVVVSRQVKSTAYWQKKAFVKNKFSIVLNGYPGTPEDIALYNVLNKYGNKMFSFQHGVTPEISYILDEEAPFCESSCSNAFFSYNSKIKKYYELLPFSIGKIHPVGMPKRFFTKVNKKLFSDDILFVSMNLYRGNINFLTGFLTDYGRFLFEKDIVERTLSKINKKVAYKPYPETNIRYTELDPVFKYIDKSDNIYLESSGVDLRYILSSYRAVVVSGASSTISWIIMSDVPLIFINNKDKIPIRNEAKSDFIDALIYFDISENGAYDQIYSYLNKPIEDIEKDWKSKKIARKNFISKWFSSCNGNAGESASNIILSKET